MRTQTTGQKDSPRKGDQGSIGFGQAPLVSSLLTIHAIWRNAWSRSAIRSSGSSIPTE